MLPIEIQFQFVFFIFIIAFVEFYKKKLTFLQRKKPLFYIKLTIETGYELSLLVIW